MTLKDVKSEFDDYVAKTKEVLATITTKITSLEEKVTLLTENSKEKDEKIKNLEKLLEKNEKNPSFAAIMSKDTNNKVTKEQIKLINLIDDEESLKKKKVNNLIIFGLEESEKEVGTELIEEEKTKMNDLFKECEIEANFSNLYRVGKERKPNKVRPICITLDDNSKMLSILKASNKLRKGKNYKNVYINKDLTIAERQKEKELKEEKKRKNTELLAKEPETTYRYCIRRNDIVKLNMNFYLSKELENNTN
jgi:hypothetical protein